LSLKKVAAVGFCLGGRYALLLGTADRRLSGLVSYYPTIDTPRLESQEVDVVERASDIACPAHLIVPGNDHITSRDVFQALQAKLQSRSQPTSIQFFPEAEHAFLQPHRTGSANAQAIGLAKPAALAFLRATLDAPSAAT
jgi:carboxymethylenebutenolidase